MNDIYHSHSRPFSAPILSLSQAADYYRTLQGEFFRGVPGVELSAEHYGLLRPTLESFRLAKPNECAELWIFTRVDGTAFVTTHLHQERPGIAFSNFLRLQSLDDVGQWFLRKWRRMVGAYYALRCLYVLPISDDAIVIPRTESPSL
jgi:hypothetical protein